MIKKSIYKKVRVSYIRNERGLGLVETLIALGVAVIVITALVSLAVFTLRASLQSQLLLRGSKLVNEEVELVRAFRDSTEWTNTDADGFMDQLLSNSCNSSPCSITTSGGTLAVSSGVETIGTGNRQISRSFQVTDPIGDGTVQTTDSVVRINVVASWTVGDETFNAYNYTELSDWKLE